jgi:hypothetical protein
MGRWIGMIAFAAALACQSGCAHGPRRFSKIDSVAALDRARAVGLAARQPDSTALPALVGRLGDSDPVVRLAAHEELRKRTGQDFGYLPWASAPERSSAIERWQTWLQNGQGGDSITPSPQLASTGPRRRAVRRVKAIGASDP